MRCKKHATDLTSIKGVCASCLRDRLLKLIAAQEAAAQSQPVSENTNKSIPPATSVSPHITRRKSDVTSVSHVPRPSYDKTPRQSDNHQRFYKSPQIAVISTTGGCIGGRPTSHRHHNKKLVKFATFQNLFRSNNNSNTNTNIPTPSSCSSSSSATTRIKNHHHRQRCVRNRGMSPVRLSDDDDEEEEEDDASSEYESIDTDTSNSCKQTPMKTIRRSGGHKSVSEMIFCLSPLVRANPNRLWKGKPAVDGTSSDVRIPVVPKLAYTKSFCANRSRKLADFGRSDPNR